MGALAYLIAGVWVGIGVGVYVLYSKSHVKEREEGKIVLYENTHVTAQGYQIMVSVANPATAPVLMKYANPVASRKQAEVVITSIVTVPYQTPLQEAEHFINNTRTLIDDASKLADAHVPVQRIIRYGHHIARGIIHSTRERHTNLLILGWRGDTQREHFMMGSTLDPVIEQAPCDLLVVKAGDQESDQEIRRILFPSKGQSPHARLAADVVNVIAGHFNATVTILHVKRQDTAESEASAMMETVAGFLRDVQYSIKIVEGDDIAESILNESLSHDIVVLGATTESLFQQLLFGSVPMKIARNCSKTVLMLKKNLGIHSWFRRWFL
jgi:nucleotide-binding universal stress UspA family protein